MSKAYRTVTETARQLKFTLRVDAYDCPLKRLAAVYNERQIFP